MSSFVSVLDQGLTGANAYIRHIGKLFTAGVIPGQLTASQRAAGANQSVDVSIGDVLLTDTLGMSFWGWTDSVTNVATNAPNTSNPRNDILVVYVDKTAYTPLSNNNVGALKFKSVAGTAAGSPVDPSDATIQSSVGAGNPFIKLVRFAYPARSDANTYAADIQDIRTLLLPNVSINRPVNVLKDAWTPGSDQVIAAGASGAWPGATAKSFTTLTGNIDVLMTFNGFTLTGGTGYWGVMIDGTLQQEFLATSNFASMPSFTDRVLLTVTPGTHTIAPYGRSNGAGTFTWKAFNGISVNVTEYR